METSDPNQPFNQPTGEPSVTPPPPPYQTPPPYNAPPPGGPSGGYPNYPRSPEIRIDMIGEAWRLFQQESTTWVISSLIFFAISAIIRGVLNAATGANHIAPGTPLPDIIRQSLTHSAVGILVSLLINSFFQAGIMRMAVRQVRGERIFIGNLFGALDAYPAVLAASFLMMVVTLIGFMFCIIPAFFLAGLLMLTIPLIVDQELGPLEAMAKSWNTLMPQALMAALFSFVAGLAGICGAILCCIGIVLTYPLIPLSAAVVYRDFFLGASTAAPQQFGSGDSGGGPPIPEAY